MGDVSAEQPLKPPISQPSNSRRGRRAGARCYHFPVGSLIEIQTNDEDFCGVYFSATVIPPPFSPKKSGRRTSNRLYVEYHNLLAQEDGPDRLREHVDLSVVRPAPPLLEVVANDFAPNDVVDAFYNDGWWTGVVSSAAEGGERFVVTFENPPDELEFGLSELRAHWDWVDGVWVGPLRQSEAAFEVGMKVEVSLEREDDGFGGAWLPATIVQDLEKGAFLVEFKDKSGRCVTGEVDSLHVRPCPPILKDIKFEKSEKVEVLFNFGWWIGLISKKLDKNGYIVVLEQMGFNNVFDRSELRPRMDWKDGKWFIPSSLTAKSDNHKTSSSSKRRRRAYISCSDSGGAPKKRNGEGEIDHPNLENEVTTIENVDVQVEDPLKMLDVENINVQVEDPLKMLNVENDAGKVGMIEEIMRTPPLIDEPRRLASTEAAMEAMVDENIETNELQRSRCVGGMTADSALVDKPSVEVAMELPNLPFVKRNAVWKAFESMEIFRRIPQKPHFEPLRQLKESSREGLAIACMVNFTNVIDRSCCLKINDPKCMFDDIKETLSDLEAHGFDVAVVQKRMMKLVAAKEKEEELVQEMNGLNQCISDHIQLKNRTEKEIGVIKEHMRRLKEQLSIEEIAGAKEVQEIARLQAELKEIEERIKSVRCDFKAAVELAAPPLDGGGRCNGS